MNSNSVLHQSKTNKSSFKTLLSIMAVNSGILAFYFFVTVSTDKLFVSLEDPFLFYISQAIFVGFGGIFAFVGSLVSERFDRAKLLFATITLSVFSIFTLLLFQGTPLLLLSSVLMGLSLGLGYPVSASMIVDLVEDGNRGKISGIIILFTFILVSLVITTVEVFSLGVTGIILLLIVLRSFSYLFLVSDKDSIQNKSYQKKSSKISWLSIIKKTQFQLYILPWILFNVASGLVSFVLFGLSDNSNYETVFAIATPLRYVGSASFGILSGILADRIGRKLPIIISLVALGISFAFLGIATSPESVFVYLTISGIAWGMLMVLYIALLGDLAKKSNNSGEKYYAIGAFLPLVIYVFLPPIPQAFNITLSPDILPSILSMLLFFSIIPVLLAVETLSTKKMRERKIKTHVEKLEKILKEARDEK